MRKKILKTIVSILITIVLFYILLVAFNFNIHELLYALKNINISLFFLLISIYFLSLILRVFRFNLILNPRIKFKYLLRIVTIHQFYNSILPFRSGEFSILFLLKKNHSRTYSESLSCLIITRLIDFSAFMFTLCISIYFTIIPSNNIFTPKYIPPILAIAIVTLYFGINFSSLSKFGIIFLIKIRNIIKIFKFHRLIIILISINKYSKKISISKIKLVGAIFFSLSLSIIIYFNTYLILNALGIHLNLFQVIIASSISFLTLMIPIQGIANFGTFEGALVFGLNIFGVSTSESFNAAVIIHLLGLFIITLMKIVIPTIIKKEDL